MGNGTRLFNSLVRNYVFFALTIGATIAILLVVWFYQMLAHLGDASSDQRLHASELVRQEYAAIPSAEVESRGGWIEVLDEELRVVYVKGERQESRSGYTESEFRALFYDRPDTPYFTSLAPMTMEDRKTFHLLVRVPRETVALAYTKANSPESLTVFWRLLGQTALGFLLLFGVNVYLYSRWTAAKITNPLRSIADGIKQIAEGRYHQRLQFAANYELTQIQDHFNQMAESLERAKEENKTLEASKQRMLVDIAHDLKTPITTIQGYVEALQLGLITDEAQRKRTLDLIHTKARRVVALIDDLFELSKLESPDYPFATKSQDLAELMRAIAAEYYDAFEAQRFRFCFEIPDQVVLVPFNEKLLHRALSNILSNALKHNPAGTEVSLRLAKAEHEVQIEISDDGVGIPARLREKVFEAFVRGDESRMSDGGTGLGLTICKHIVELHGGRIHLDTSGGMTSFRIAIPNPKL